MDLKKIGIVGTGKMGEALVSGLLKSKLTSPTNLCIGEIIPQRREYIAKAYHIPCHSDDLKVVEESEIIIIAVQPRDVKTSLNTIGPGLTSRHLIISIAAGVTIGFISKALNKDVPIIRVMPNTPCMIGEGMTALAPASNVSEENLQVAREIFSSVGRVVVVEERLLNAVTGLSGSGPAYIYLIIEALADAGLKVGIPKNLAIILAAQTMLGSAKMVLETNEHPAKLRDMVATPGGTTVSGLAELEKGKIRSIFIEAVEKASLRAKELSIE